MARARPPLTIIVYVVTVAVALAAALVDAGPLPRLVMGIVIVAAALFGLWRGKWVAWTALASFDTLTVAAALSDRVWWIAVLKGAMIALLLAAPTRRHVAWPRILRRRHT